MIVELSLRPVNRFFETCIKVVSTVLLGIQNSTREDMRLCY